MIALGGVSWVCLEVCHDCAWRCVVGVLGGVS